MNNFYMTQIGTIHEDERGFRLILEPKYIPALEGLDGFSHLQIIWWFDRCDNKKSRSRLSQKKPYVKGPDLLGTFATRSPQRPNPLGVSCASITYIDYINGEIGLAYIDALGGSPVLDVKPYTPSLDRVEQPSVPAWCSHWPNSLEQSGDFNWEAEFNF